LLAEIVGTPLDIREQRIQVDQCVGLKIFDSVEFVPFQSVDEQQSI